MFRFNSSQKTSTRKRIISAGKPRRKSLVEKKPDEEIKLSQKDGDNMITKPSKSLESRNDRSFVPSMDDIFFKKVANFHRKKKKINSIFDQMGKESVLLSPPPGVKFTKAPSSDNNKKRKKATIFQPLKGKKNRNTYGSINSLHNTQTEGSLYFRKNSQLSNSSCNTQTNGSVEKESLTRPLSQFRRSPSSDNNKKRKKATIFQPLKGKKNRNTYGSINSLHNTQTEGSLYFRKNSQLLSSPRAGHWYSKNSSSSRENSNKCLNQTTFLEEYSKQWRTPQTSTASEQTAGSIQVRSLAKKQSSPDNQNQRLQNSQPALCQPRVLSLSQIVLGKKLLTNKCCIELMIGVEPYLQLDYIDDLENRIQVKIYFSNITEGIKYFIPNDEAGTSIKSFMVFDAKYDKSDNLHKSREFYDWSSDNIDKKYIILEPRSVKRFQSLIEWLQSKKPTNIQRLSTEDASKYIQKIRQRQSWMNRQVTRNNGDILQDHQQTVVKLEKSKQKLENSVQGNKDVCSDAAASEVVTTTASANSIPDVNTDEIIKLFVFEEETHESFDLRAKLCNTVGSIKHKIMEQKKIPIDQQCLLWKGDELLDVRKLYEYGIKKNSTLFLKKCISL